MASSNVVQRLRASLGRRGAPARDGIEARLREAEERHRRLVEQLPAMAYTVPIGEANTPLYMSPHGEQLLGYTAEEWAREPDPWVSFMHPDDRERVAAEFSERRASGDVHLEYRFIAKDGRVVWVRDRLVLVRDAAGEPLYWQGIAFDITTSKAAEAALRESEDRFRGAFDHAGIGMALSGLDRRLLRVNAAMGRFLGYTADEFEGLSIEDISFPDDYGANTDQIERLLAGEREMVEFEKRYRHRDGRVLWGAVSASLVRSGDGAPLHLISQVQDITERKRAEEQLREAEGRYRALVEQMPAVTFVEPATATGATAYMSPQIEQLLGYAPEEFIGDADLWWSLIHPDDRARVRAEIERTNRTGEPYNIEYRIHAHDGRELWTQTHATLCRDVNGAPLYWQGIMHDVTARKRAEDELRRREREFKALADNAPDAIVRYDAAARYLYANPLAARLLGGAPEELTGRTVGEVTGNPERQAYWEGQIASVLASGEAADVAYAADTTAGPRLFEARLVPEQAVGGSVTSALLVSRDVTESKRAEEALRESEQRFRSVFESPALGVALNAPDGTWLQVNRALCELVGYSEAELRATTFQAITHPDDLGANMGNVFGLLAGDIASYQMEKRYLHKDGHVVWVQLNVALVRDAREQPLYFVAQIHDISARKAIEEQLRVQARYDALTRLPNRALYMERLEHALARARRSGELFGVMFIDLDGFKAVNDTLGHAAGDRLLAEVAARLQGCLRAGDTVARLGGDEFTALVDGMAGPQVASVVARRMIEAVGQPYDLDGNPAHVGASIGISWGGPTTTDAARLLQEADTALYEAKSRGKRQHVMFDELRAELERVAPAHLAPGRPIPLASRRGS